MRGRGLVSKTRKSDFAANQCDGGRTSLWQMWGVGDKRQLLLVGPPLAQLGIADQHAKAGQVILSPEATGRGGQRVIGEPLPAGHLQATARTEAPCQARRSERLHFGVEDCLRHTCQRSC